MATLYSYTKQSDQFTTYLPSAPLDGSLTELCTLDDGRTVVSVDGELPAQPVEVVLTELVLDDALRAEIKAKSPHVALINARVVERIRAEYSQDDEIKALRIGGDYAAAWGEHVKVCRAWGDEQKEALGL